MTSNRYRYSIWDFAVSQVVHEEFSRNKTKTVSGLARHLGMRRSTLQVRVNGYQPFSAGLLLETAQYLGISVAEIMHQTENRLAEMKDAS